MGCVAIVNKNIADIKVDDNAKKEGGPGLSQYLKWRSASLSCVLAVMAVAEAFNVNEVRYTYVKTMEEMDGPLALQMRMIIWINAAINVFCVGLSTIAWFMLLQAYSKRKNDLAASIVLARKAYVIDFGSFIVFYLCIPLAVFFNTTLLQRDMCVYTLYSIMKGGPVTRQAMATAATMKGDAALAALCMRDPPPTSQLGDWAGYSWCNAKPNFIEYLFGPDPATAAFSPTTSEHKGIITHMIMLMSALTGAQCKTPSLYGTPSVSFMESVDMPLGELARKGARLFPEVLATRAAMRLADVGLTSPARINATVQFNEGFRTATDCMMQANSTGCFDIWRASLAADSRGIPPGDLLTGQTAVCQFAAAMDVTADMARMSMIFVVQAVGLWCCLQAFLKVLPTCSGIIRGLERACINSKSMMPSCSLPGYVLIVGACCFMPPMCIALCSTCQLMAHPLFSLAFLFISLFLGWNLKVGGTLTKSGSYKAVMPPILKEEKKQKKFRLLGGVFLLAWIIFSAIYANKSSQILNMINLRMLCLNPTTLAYMVSNWLYNRTLARLIYTDYIFISTFAVLDDNLRKVSDARKLEKATLLREWYTLTEDWVQLQKLSTDEYDCPAPLKPPEPPKGKGKQKGKGKGKGKGVAAPPYPNKGKAKGKGSGKGIAKGAEQ